jgi:hypothetical protein
MPIAVHLVHGNDEARVNEARFALIRRHLPNGEEDGEVVDLRGPGNQPLQLDRCAGQIIEELGTMSLVPDQKRIVVVWELMDFRSGKEGSLREEKAKKSAKKAAKKGAATRDPATMLEDYIRESGGDSENALIFVFNEDDDRKRVSKTSSAFQLVQRLGNVQEFSEKRVDWALEDALFARRADESIRLVREWEERGGNAFRILTTLNGFVQLLLQARLEMEAVREGRQARGAFAAEGLRPSLATVPDFKARKFRQMAGDMSMEKLRECLGMLNQVQKAMFPTGEELVVPDAGELTEVLLIRLVTPDY